MTPDEHAKLDEIANRLGALYQSIGRLDLSDADTERDLLDAVLALTQDVESVSRRKERAADQCH